MIIEASTARKKVMAIKVQKPTYHIENCNVKNTTAPTNGHTRDSVVALAKALEANANAIAEVARALKGGNAILENAFKFGNS